MLPAPVMASNPASSPTHTAAHNARAGVERRRTTPTQANAARAFNRVAPKNSARAPEPRIR